MLIDLRLERITSRDSLPTAGKFGDGNESILRDRMTNFFDDLRPDCLPRKILNISRVSSELYNERLKTHGD